MNEITAALLASGHYTGPVSEHDPRPGYRMYTIDAEQAPELVEKTKHFGSHFAFAVTQADTLVQQIEFICDEFEKAKRAKK